MNQNRFRIEIATLPGVSILHRLPIQDSRGYLERIYCADDLKNVLGTRRVVQINHTLTRVCGTVRGMHYQAPPCAETKVVSCVRGEVYDVAVDIRSGSPTFLQWFGFRLSETKHASMVIPEGFAHGFQALTADCEMLYLHTAAYCRTAEAALNPLDPRLSIGWPLEVAEMSQRDRQHPLLDDTFKGVES